MTEEYLRRNLIHAKAVGVRAGLYEALRRLNGTRRPPKWLTKLLSAEYLKANAVAEEVAKHRDEVKP